MSLINLFHEAEPSNWTFSMMVSGSLHSRIVPISINPPDVGPCNIMQNRANMILLQKLCRRNPLKHGIHTLLADAQLNWTSILLKFGYHRSSVLLREERLRVLWCRTRLNRQRRAGMRWLTCLWPFGMLAGILKNPESKYFTRTNMLSYLNKGLKNTHATARCRETYSCIILTLKRRLILLYIVWHDNTHANEKKVSSPPRTQLTSIFEGQPFPKQGLFQSKQGSFGF